MPEHVNRVVERARTAAMGDPGADPTARLDKLEGDVADLAAKVALLEENATQDAVKDLTAWSGQTAAIAVPSPAAAGFVEPEPEAMEEPESQEATV